MERSGGKWIPLNQYAQKRRVSKRTVYRKIRNGEISKRNGDSGAEIFLAGDELEAFESLPVDAASSEPAAFETDVDSDEAYGIADQTLRAMITMHREVLGEKSRMLKEWEEELRKREERLEEMTGTLASREAILTERNSEVRELKRSIRHRDELVKEHERALNEYRRLNEQREEIERMADSTREELTSSLAEKDNIIDEKERIISEQRRAMSQRDDITKDNSKTVNEFKKALEEARALIREKDELIDRIKNDPTDLDGKLAVRDRMITEMKGVIKTLESRLDVQNHEKELTGFQVDRGPETGVLIQDQLEYLMQSENMAKYRQDAVNPEEVASANNLNGAQGEKS